MRSDGHHVEYYVFKIYPCGSIFWAEGGAVGLFQAPVVRRTYEQYEPCTS